MSSLFGSLTFPGGDGRLRAISFGQPAGCATLQLIGRAIVRHRRLRQTGRIGDPYTA
ncbi:MAG: hypothetical protein RMM98_06995 [Acidobacteriota bacterium]|nr:hypothetical protein [Blastocatellia bacterium]MDW8239343.1 hypothetical protein [Acidobacteriota bacterium]